MAKAASSSFDYLKVEVREHARVENDIAGETCVAAIYVGPSRVGYKTLCRKGETRPIQWLRNTPDMPKVTSADLTDEEREHVLRAATPMLDKLAEEYYGQRDRVEAATAAGRLDPPNVEAMP